MKSPQFSSAICHPRYWLTWLTMAIIALMAQLPFRVQIALGILVGDLSYFVAKRRRLIACKNIDLCFPELSKKEREDLVKEHFRTNGITLFETGMAWFMPYGRLHKRFTVKGKEHWDALQERQQGALVVGLHFNSLEICNVHVNHLFDFHISYRAHNNPVYDLIQHWRREHHNPRAEAINRYDIRGMVNKLKRGGLLWFAPDQDYGRKVSEFVPWFGIEAATVSSTPRLLKMAKVPAIGISHRRLPGYKGYEIEFMPAIEGLPSRDSYTDLVTLNQYIERCVRNNPTEYLWVHRRFKTRPEGTPKRY